MALGLVGRKVGMTRIFTEDGVSIPVTVIEATPNRIAQIKSEATDGYNALQVTAGQKVKAARLLGLPNHQTLSNWLKRWGMD